MTPAGVAAVAVAIAAAGFFGGVQVQKSRGDSGGSVRRDVRGSARGRLRPARARGQAGAGATPGAGGQGQAGGGATVGQVASIDGSTLYVDDSSGTTIKVRLAKGGSVTRTAKAKATAIHPGDTVIVQGETASSGTVVASTIRATASNAGAAALGGFGAAPGGG